MPTRCIDGPLSSHVRAYFFFFNDTATTEIYTLSLHDALPIYASSASGRRLRPGRRRSGQRQRPTVPCVFAFVLIDARSEEHTSELQSPDHLVCRLLLEKKKNNSKDMC